MAEGNTDEPNEAGWWGSWIQTAKENTWLQAAKEKSTAALEQMKKDLSEFTCTVQTDASKAVATTSGTIKDTIKPENAEAAKSRVKSGISSFLDGITRAFTIPPDDGQEETITIQHGGEPVYDRGKARLAAIQMDLGTYCKEPSGSPEHYKQWRENFDPDTKKGEISEMLVIRAEVRALYTKLVPSEVSHADFWARYFYKVHQLQLDEARKVALMRRAEDTRDDSFTWDDDMEDKQLSEEEEASDSEDKSVHSHDSPTKTDLAARLSPQKTDPESEQTGIKTNASPERVNRVSTDSKLIKQDNSLGKGADSPPGKVDTSDTVVKNMNTVIMLDESIHTDMNRNMDSVKAGAGETTQCQSSESVHSTYSGSALSVKVSQSPTDKLSPPEVKVGNETKPCVEGTNETSAGHHDNSNSISEQSTTTDNVSRVSESDNSKDPPLSSVDTKVMKAVGEDKPVTRSTYPDPQAQAVISTGTMATEHKPDDKVVKELRTREKGDLVVIGSGSASPVSEASNNTKDPSSEDVTDEDWVEDFNIELTEEDIRAAEEAAKKYKTPLELEDLDMEEDDWNWD